MCGLMLVLCHMDGPWVFVSCSVGLLKKSPSFVYTQVRDEIVLPLQSFHPSVIGGSVFDASFCCYAGM